MLKESFSFDDPKSIIQSNLPLAEKKLQLASLKLDQDEKLKKLKKEWEKSRPKVNLGGKIVVFLTLYLLTGWQIEFTLFSLYFLFLQIHQVASCRSNTQNQRSRNETS